MECFQAGKNEAGPDHYQVRPYLAWYLSRGLCRCLQHLDVG
jgi:hypothetical protein